MTHEEARREAIIALYGWALQELGLASILLYPTCPECGSMRTHHRAARTSQTPFSSVDSLAGPDREVAAHLQCPDCGLVKWWPVEHLSPVAPKSASPGDA